MEINKIAYDPVGSAAEESFVFLDAQIKYRAQRLLSRDTLEKLLESGSLDTAVTMLAEAGYPDLSGLSEDEIEQALSQRREELFADLEAASPCLPVTDIFRVRYDYHNAKTIIKSEATGLDSSYLLSGSGRVEPKQLESYYLENDFRYVPDALAKAMQEAKGILAATGNPQLSDIALDRACFAEMSELAASIYPETDGEGFMQGYVALLIDRANLGSLIRCARIGKDAEFLRSMLIAGGTVAVDKLVAASGSEDAVVPLFEAGALKEAVRLGTAAMKGGPLSPFEKECDNAISRYLRNESMLKYGVELATQYLTAEETVLSSVRMILSGLRYGIAADTIRERLREVYA